MKKINLNYHGFEEIPFAHLFHDFFNSEKAGGLILVFCTIISLVLANSGIQSDYLAFWNIHFAGHTIVHWINDGLMTIFFLLIGLELEREIYTGQLSSLKSASLPIFGAIGGMVIPAGLFYLVNHGTPGLSGSGIPMATDIAFAIGILSLLGKRMPDSLKIFLTALAVIDDLGAILIIAIFYTETLVLSNLFIALAIFGILIGLNRLRIYNLLPYLLGGVAMWYFMLHSGIHATVTGVLLAFAIPFGGKGSKSPSFVMQHVLHKPVAFIILPVFALANTGVILGSNWYHGLHEPVSIGIILGLFIGKPLGIFLFSMLGIASGLCILPVGSKWKHVLGVGFLGGIGFTMSIFITLLAFNNQESIDHAKISILVASLLSGISGFLFLRLLKPAEK